MRIYTALIVATVVFSTAPAWSCDAFLSDEELTLTEQKTETELLVMIKEAEAESQARQIAETPK